MSMGHMFMRSDGQTREAPTIHPLTKILVSLISEKHINLGTPRLLSCFDIRRSGDLASRLAA
jgi:hypothetical protein